MTVIRLTSSLSRAGNTWVVAVDGVDAVGIRIGDHATLAVPAEVRMLSSDCVEAFPIVRPGRPLRLDARPGAHHYVTLTACVLTEITEGSARSLMNETTALDKVAQ